MNTKEPTKWHYTTIEALLGIIETRCILPDDQIAHDPRGFERSSPPSSIIWFSSNQAWEQSVVKVWNLGGSTMHLDLDGLLNHGIMPCRFAAGPNVELYPWRILRNMTKMKSEVANDLLAKAELLDSDPEEWFGTSNPIRSEQFGPIEIYCEGRWHDSEMDFNAGKTYPN